MVLEGHCVPGSVSVDTGLPCASSKGMYAFVFQGGLIILDSKYMYRFLKYKISIIKGMAKISFHYLGKSAS